MYYNFDKFIILGQHIITVEKQNFSTKRVGYMHDPKKNSVWKSKLLYYIFGALPLTNHEKNADPTNNLKVYYEVAMSVKQK